MSKIAERIRWSSLGLGGLGAAVCCALPILVGAGIISSGVGIGAWLELGGVGLLVVGAVGLALAGLTVLWQTRRRSSQHTCEGSGGCSCAVKDSDASEPLASDLPAPAETATSGSLTDPPAGVSADVSADVTAEATAEAAAAAPPR